MTQEMGCMLQNQALRKCTGAAYGSYGKRVEKIAGVESVDTIMDAAQTRCFARAVADPTAIGDLWPASLKPDNNNEDDECVEEDGRGWGDHGAFWVQNDKADGYTLVASYRGCRLGLRGSHFMGKRRR